MGFDPTMSICFSTPSPRRSFPSWGAIERWGFGSVPYSRVLTPSYPIMGCNPT
eukprot:CAMPEP_0194372628 /NCGR_PEP_ID=MMETSP0174-20130528/21019_1 /TAXON_ID=216777 /ORGANISM="Proboscia alata, Strain PI-D3" /LENGTH=52 /DNA_ID=CAMNT_0039151265 /DNA_START=128 /DNA_END=282 /DNA_ORIENTATION=+